MTIDVSPALARLIRLVSRVLPDVDDAWADAMSAELRAIPTRRERIAFTASCLRGLAGIALARQLRRWRTNVSTLCIAAALGILVATVDLRADSRWPLSIGLLLSCAAIGWTRPRVAVPAAVLAALGLPLLAALSGFRGPYEMDRADVWYPLLPALVTAAVAATIRRRLSAHRSV